MRYRRIELNTFRPITESTKIPETPLVGNIAANTAYDILGKMEKSCHSLAIYTARAIAHKKLMIARKAEEVQ